MPLCRSQYVLAHEPLEIEVGIQVRMPAVLQWKLQSQLLDERSGDCGKERVRGAHVFITDGFQVRKSDYLSRASRSVERPCEQRGLPHLMGAFDEYDAVAPGHGVFKLMVGPSQY